MLDDPDVARLDAGDSSGVAHRGRGARRDLGQMDAALRCLRAAVSIHNGPEPGSVRLWYAYADALQAAGRKGEAARWFAVASAALDTTGGDGRRPSGPPRCHDSQRTDRAAHGSDKFRPVQSTSGIAVHKPVSPPLSRSRYRGD